MESVIDLCLKKSEAIKKINIDKMWETPLLGLNPASYNKEI